MHENPPSRERIRWTWVGCLTLLAVATLALAVPVATTIAHKLTAPVMLDRQGSAIADHAVRVRRGLPIYAEPDAHFCPLLYTPLFYYFGAGAMAIFGEGMPTLRALALGLAVASLLVMGGLVHRVTRAWWPVALVAPLGLAAYPGTAYFLDLPRVDAASTLWLLLGIAAGVRARRARAGLVMALCFFLAFWSKQSVVLAAGAFLGLMLFSRPAPSLLAAAALALALPASLLIGNGLTEGWLWVFVGDISGKDPFSFSRLASNFREDWLFSLDPESPQMLGRLAVPAAIAARAGVLLWRRWEGSEADRQLLHLLMALAAVALYTTASRARLGGSPKTLMAPYLLMAAVVPVAIWWLARKLGPPARSAGVLALCILLADAHFPRTSALPSAAEDRQWQSFVASVERYAEQGQVWAAMWGYLTTPMPGQEMRPTLLELNHYLGFEGERRNPLPRELARAIETRRFAAIFLPERRNSVAFADLLREHYTARGPEFLVPTGVKRGTRRIRTYVPR